MTKLLLYGLQRSGTNFLRTLLTMQYRVRFLNRNGDRRAPLHTHFRLYSDKDIVPEPQYRNDVIVPDFAGYERLLKERPDYYLVVSKDPYSWLLSYRRWARKCNWPAVGHDYVTEYNLFYGKWLELARQTERIVFIRYVDLLRDRREALCRLGAQMGLIRRALFFPLMPAALLKVRHSRVFTGKRRDLYLKQEYMKDYSVPELLSINNLLDPAVVSGLGYHLHRQIPPQ